MWRNFWSLFPPPIFRQTIITILPTEPSVELGRNTSGTFWIGSEVECGYTTTASPWPSSLGLPGSVELDPMAAAAWGRKYYSSSAAATRMFPGLHHHHQDSSSVGLSHHHHHHHQPRGPAVGGLKEEPLSGSQLAAARSWMQPGVEHARSVGNIFLFCCDGVSYFLESWYI